MSQTEAWKGALNFAIALEPFVVELGDPFLRDKVHQPALQCEERHKHSTTNND